MTGCVQGKFSRLEYRVCGSGGQAEKGTLGRADHRAMCTQALKLSLRLKGRGEEPSRRAFRMGGRARCALYMEAPHCWGQRGGGGAGETPKDEDQRELGSGAGAAGWAGPGSYSRRGEEGTGSETFRRTEHWLAEMTEEGRGATGALEAPGVGDL